MTAPPSMSHEGPPGTTTTERRRATVMRTQELPVTGTHLAQFLVRDRTKAERYATAVAVTMAAAVPSVLMASQLDRVSFVFFWPAVVFSAIIGGFWPAALSSVLSVLVVDLLVIAPHARITASPREVLPLAIFLLASLGVSSVANALRVARARSGAATTELQKLALELERQADELELQLEQSQALQEELEQTGGELASRTREAETASAFSRGILASISDPFVVHDADWRFVYINEQADAIFRRSARAPRGSLVGVRLWDAYPDLVGTEHERQMRRAATERIPVSYEAYYADAGTWSVLSCYPLPDGGLATQWKDVTARRRAEETARYLARASDVLGASLEYETTMNDLAHLVVPELAEWCTVHLVEPDGGVRQVAVAHGDAGKAEWARQLDRRYPHDPASPQGLHSVMRTGEPLLISEVTDEMLVAGARDAEHLRIAQSLGLRSVMIVPLVARERVLGALSLYTVKGGRRYTEADLALAMELARRAALAVDNSLLHRAERVARLAADDANKAKMQFLATMSHELRTPLNAIGGYAELMRLGLRGPVTEAQLQDLERIGNSQRSLLGLINDILNFAKVEAGHVEFTIADVPMAALLRDLEEVVAPQLMAGKLRFEGARCEEGLAVRGDREKIRQIVLNLLTNAIKFTPAGGSIAIVCARAGQVARVDVIDTGIGIAADRLDSVFDPFVQLDRTLTSQHEGTGLGLAISRDLARAMKGDILARSEPGRGSVFSLVLPLA
jgi:signal transduction histidine kinase/PAS domain-containing protein